MDRTRNEEDANGEGDYMTIGTEGHDDSTLQDGQAASEPLIVRLGADIGLSELAIEASGCGQYLMLTCSGALVALVGAMGSDVESVEFADGRSYRVDELMDLLAA